MKIISMKSMMAGTCLMVLAATPGPGAEVAGGGPPTVVIRDSGMTRTFELMLNEVVINHGGKRETRPVTAGSMDELQERAAGLLDQQPGAPEAELVAYEAGVVRREGRRRLLTRRILVAAVPGAKLPELGGEFGLVLVSEPAYAPEMAVYSAADPFAALAAMATLRKHAGVRSADVLLARQRVKRSTPTDPLFPQQWHFRNTSQGGGALWIDANLSAAWESYRGGGVTIAILDDGVQYTHPDLAPNYNASIDYDFNSSDDDPSPVNLVWDDHGTSCAGVAAARGNNGLGGCGAAYEATLTGFRLVGTESTDQDEGDAFALHNDLIQIKSNSWGVSDDGETLEGPGMLAAAALANGTASGRGGLGTIYVFAGGNGLDLADNSNYDGYANSIHTIAVGAVNDFGFQSYYSERGANLHVCAPSNGGQHNEGIVTTDLIGTSGSNTNSTGADDLGDPSYTRNFGGTSSSAPLVSGVCALILQANPNLGWRDVQEILMRSARQVHHSDPDWITNGAGLHFNHKYGAGLVDAQASVKLAENWVDLGAQTFTQVSQTGLSATIPDASAVGVTRTFNVARADLRVEHVTLTISSAHARRGDLEITLTSPAGTASRLAEQHFDPNANYSGWTFSSVRHWGETAAGDWTLTVRDRQSGTVGVLTAAVLKVYGSAISGARVVPAAATLVSEGNLPANRGVDPGERVTFGIGLKNIGAGQSGAITAALLNTGGVTAAGPAQDYGVLASGGPVVTRSFGFTAGGACGSSTKLILRLESGGSLLGFATWQIPLGVVSVKDSPTGGAITIRDNNVANPYPSTVNLTGVSGRVQKITATVNAFSHSYPYDVNLILKGPAGLYVTLFSDATDNAVSYRNYVFDDNVPEYLPTEGLSPSGSYRPWDPFGSQIVGDTTGEPGYSMVEFTGLNANGGWGLYAEDSGEVDAGSIGSWRITVTSVDCTDNIYLTNPTLSAGEGGGSLEVAVTRTGGREGSATVHYATAPGTATAGSDYTAVSGTLTFAPGETSRTFSIPILNDTAAEGEETFQVLLSAVGGNSLAGSPMSGEVTILDDDFSLLEGWRLTHFGSPDNTGDGADLNDFDHDGLANLVEYAFGLDPRENSAGELPQPQRVGDNLVISFTGLPDVAYGAEWSSSLALESWLPMTDTPNGDEHRFTIPVAGVPRIFVRLSVTHP